MRWAVEIDGYDADGMHHQEYVIVRAPDAGVAQKLAVETLKHDRWRSWTLYEVLQLD